MDLFKIIFFSQMNGERRAAAAAEQKKDFFFRHCLNSGRSESNYSIKVLEYFYENGSLGYIITVHNYCIFMN